MLTVNSGWLGPEMTTNPAVEGTLANNRTTATIKLRSRKSAFENNCLIPLRPVLKQPSLAFKILWHYVYGVANHLERQFHRDARYETRFHCAANEIATTTKTTATINRAVRPRNLAIQEATPSRLSVRLVM